MIEVHPAGHDLIVSVAHVPIFGTAQRLRVVFQQVNQYAAGGVDPDDAVSRQVHELDELGVRGLLELARDVVGVRYRMDPRQIVLGAGNDLVGQAEGEPVGYAHSGKGALGRKEAIAALVTRVPVSTSDGTGVAPHGPDGALGR